MPIDPNLIALMPHSVTISPYSSQDQYAAVTYGAGVGYTCLIRYDTLLKRDSEGMQKVSRAQIYLDRAPGVGVRDKVTMPDGSTPVILSVEKFADPGGDYLEVVNLY